MKTRKESYGDGVARKKKGRPMSRFISLVKNKQQGQKAKDAKAQEKTTRCGYKLEKKKIQTARFLQSVLVKFLHQFKTLLTVRNPETQTTKQRSCPSILHCQLIPYYIVDKRRNLCPACLHLRVNRSYTSYEYWSTY